MRIHTVLLVASVLVGSATAAPVDGDTPTVPNMNKLVDQLVSALKAYQMLDPMLIPQYNIILRKTVGDTQTSGNAVIANTSITGLSFVHRQGDTKFEDYTVNDTFSVKLHMGQGNVKVLSDSHVHFKESSYPPLKIAADIVDIAMSFAVSPGQLPGITNFSIKEFKYAKFQVNGLQEHDPLVSALSSSYLAILNRRARYMLTTSIKPILEEELKNFKLTYSL